MAVRSTDSPVLQPVW